MRRQAQILPKLQPKTYTINLNPNGGTMVGEATVVITYGEAFSAVLPRRTGYTFIGWYTGKGDDSLRLTDQPRYQTSKYKKMCSS